MCSQLCSQLDKITQVVYSRVHGLVGQIHKLAWQPPGSCSNWMTHVVSTVLSQAQAELSPRLTHTGTHLSRYFVADRRTVVTWDVADLCSTKSILQGEASLVAALVSSTSAWMTGQRSCSSSARSQVTGPQGSISKSKGFHSACIIHSACMVIPNIIEWF